MSERKRNGAVQDILEDEIYCILEEDGIKYELFYELGLLNEKQKELIDKTENQNKGMNSFKFGNVVRFDLIDETIEVLDDDGVWV